jgi:prepilin-type N-terminal cleavage/methylation domain-containing protein
MRRGYSLIELLLVLAVLVMVAAMATPAVLTVLEGTKLRKAGDQMRTEWARSRNLAMKTGRLHMFRYKLGADEYEIRPWYAEDDALESSSLVSPMDSTTAGGAALPAGTTQPSATGSLFSQTTKKLPEGILFAFGEAQVDTRAANVDTDIAAQGVDGWSLPILFYPDGSSSTARLTLVNKRQQYVSLDLRGLTGLSQISDLQTEQEASQ